MICCMRRACELSGSSGQSASRPSSQLLSTATDFQHSAVHEVRDAVAAIPYISRVAAQFPGVALVPGAVRGGSLPSMRTPSPCPPTSKPHFVDFHAHRPASSHSSSAVAGFTKIPTPGLELEPQELCGYSMGLVLNPHNPKQPSPKQVSCRVERD